MSVVYSFLYDSVLKFSLSAVTMQKYTVHELEKIQNTFARLLLSILATMDSFRSLPTKYIEIMPQKLPNTHNLGPASRGVHEWYQGN